ncbi:unnamed protein product [Brassica oleracea var. botrytis]|uniref:Retrotransposon gag domain-containing protein n=2 Tax=Brassica oleracea TaxID=3712 RepID=A0A0D3ALG3_BRAOL
MGPRKPSTEEQLDDLLLQRQQGHDNGRNRVRRDNEGNDNRYGNVFAEKHHEQHPVPRVVPHEDFHNNDRGNRQDIVLGNHPPRWETSFRSEIPEFLGTLNPKEFIDWLNIVEEILEFKQVPDDMRVSLVATRFKGRAMAWW